MTLEELRAAYLAGRIEKELYIASMHRLHDVLFQYSRFITSTDIDEIRIAESTVTFRSRRHRIRMRCDPRDLRAAPMEILNFGSYEADETETMLKLVKDGSTVFDVGANIGWFSVLFGKALPHASVHAFEPIPSTFVTLTQNLRLNRVTNVKPHNIALTDRNGRCELYFESDQSARASLADLSVQGSAVKVTCSTRTLDEVAQDLDRRVDFVKADCEGGELLVWRGGLGVLRDHKPIVFTEMLRKWAARFGYHPNDVVSLFASLGFGCFVCRAGGLARFGAVTDETADTNFVFLHLDRHKLLVEELVRA